MNHIASGVDTAGSWLDVLTRRVPEFERTWRAGPVPKERAVRERLGVSAVRYVQLIDRALDLPDSLVFDPALVARLRSEREARHGRLFRSLGLAGASG